MDSTINLRVDNDTKNGIEAFCKGIGSDVSTITRMFYACCINEGILPFTPKYKPIVTAQQAINAMRECQKISSANGNSEMTLDEINEVVSECRKESRTG